MWGAANFFGVPMQRRAVASQGLVGDCECQPICRVGTGFGVLGEQGAQWPAAAFIDQKPYRGKHGIFVVRCFLQGLAQV